MRFLTNVVWSFQCLRTMVLCLINPLILKTYCNYKLFYYLKDLSSFNFFVFHYCKFPAKLIPYLLTHKSKVICNGSLVSRTWQCVAKKSMLGNFVWMGYVMKQLKERKTKKLCELPQIWCNTNKKFDLQKVSWGD